MANTFYSDRLRDWFHDCEISDAYELLDDYIRASGNFGAIFRCRQRYIERSVNNLDKLSYKEIQNMAPEHLQKMAPRLTKEVFIGKMLECFEHARECADSLVSDAGESLHDEREIYVVKIIPLNGSTNDIENNQWMKDAEADREAQRMERMDLLCSFYENDLLQTPRIRGKFKSDKAFFVVMDWINGKTLFDLVLNRHPPDFVYAVEAENNYPATAFLAFQVLQTLLRLHSMGFIHLDIKPENIMRSVRQSVGHGGTPREREDGSSGNTTPAGNTAATDDDADDDDEDCSNMFALAPPGISTPMDSTEEVSYVYTIVDFGMCTKVNDRGQCIMPCGQGTEGFMSPEIEKGDSEGLAAYTPACDAWSLGSTLYFFLTSFLFNEDERMKTCQPYKDTTNSPFHLVYWLTHDDESTRMTIQQAICHDFLKHHGLAYSEERVNHEVRGIVSTENCMRGKRDLAAEAAAQIEKTHPISKNDAAFAVMAGREQLEETKFDADKKRKKKTGRTSPGIVNDAIVLQRSMSEKKTGRTSPGIVNDAIVLQRSMSADTLSYLTNGTHKASVSSAEKLKKYRDNGADEDDRNNAPNSIVRSSSHASIMSSSGTGSEKSSESGQVSPCIISRGSSSNNQCTVTYKGRKKPSELEEYETILDRKELCLGKVEDIEAMITNYNERANAAADFKDQLHSAQIKICESLKKAYEWKRPALPDDVRKKLKACLKSMTATSDAVRKMFLSEMPNSTMLNNLRDNIQWYIKRATQVAKAHALTQKPIKEEERALNKLLGWLRTGISDIENVNAARGKIRSKYDKTAVNKIQYGLKKVKKKLTDTKKELDKIVAESEPELATIAQAVHNLFVTSGLEVEKLKAVGMTRRDVGAGMGLEPGSLYMHDVSVASGLKVEKLKAVGMTRRDVGAGMELEPGSL